MNIVRLENWSVGVIHDNPYMPPEQAGQCLQGEAYGHPKSEDGPFIHTTQIMDVDNRTVTTSSGTVYELGEIEATYLAWCEKTDGVRTPCEGDWIRAHK
jgi:hypothetical protein